MDQYVRIEYTHRDDVDSAHLLCNHDNAASLRSSSDAWNGE